MATETAGRSPVRVYMGVCVPVISVRLRGLSLPWRPHRLAADLCQGQRIVYLDRYVVQGYSAQLN